jgi:two-component system, response regulator PdtaR
VVTLEHWRDSGAGDSAPDGVFGRATPIQPTVLIVDDEILIRLTAADGFVDAGFAVLEAANGDEALTVLEANPTVDALFTDVNMPGSIDGFGLARAAGERWPNLAVVVSSGRIARPGDLPREAAFISKPYSPDVAAMIVRRMVDARRTAPAVSPMCGRRNI